MKGWQQAPSKRYQTTRREEFIQQELKADPEWKLHRTWTRSGIRAEFYREPPTFNFPNKFTLIDETTLEGIQHMLKEGWITEIKDWRSNPGTYSKLLLVKKATGKWRFTLACIVVNKYTVKRHFKTDDLRNLKAILEPGMYMALLDIKDAFYSKPQRLFREHRRYFRFATRTAQEIRVYQFTVTPQGWSSSPRALHIMLKEATKEAHHHGILHARATDDIIIVHKAERTCGRQLLKMTEILQRHGYIVKKEKTRLPSHKQEWFGAKIETSPYVKFSATTKKIKEMKRMAGWMIRKDNEGKVTPRMTAGFIGKIRSAALYLECAMAHTANLINAQTQALATNGQQWDRPGRLSKTARMELYFFLTRCEYQGRHLPNNLIEVLLVSDASNSGFGGKILKIPQDWRAHVQQTTMGFWTGAELKMHINEKEHEGSFRVAQGCLNPARSYVCRQEPNIYHLNMLTDNQVSRTYHNKQGGKSPLLNKTTMQFQKWATTAFYPSKLVVTSTYLEGDKMIEIGGDELSRMGRLGEEIQLNPKMFKTLCRLLHFNPEIDLFATRHNSQLQQFYTAHHDLQAQGTNAMIQDWTRPAYAFPPINLIFPFLQKIQRERATVLAVLPLTPSAKWYPLLQRLVSSHPVLLAQGRKLFLSPNDYLKPRKQWSKWAWIGILLSPSTSPSTRAWRLKTRRKWLRGSGHRTLFQGIRTNGKPFKIGMKESMVKNRLTNLTLSSALRNG